MNRYVQSKYNYLVRYNNSVIIYNTHTGALCSMSNAEYIDFCNNNLNEALIDKLFADGFYVDNQGKELAQINNDRKLGILDPSKITIRVYTTTGCNARCDYCFEKGAISKRMDINTADAFLKYFKKTINTNIGIKEIKICWFGGEPLLNSPIISYLTPKIQNICATQKRKCKFEIISNGSLFNNSAVYNAKNRWNISNVQITLDGYGDKYDNIKKYTDKSKYNFNSVIDNIEGLLKNNISVTIRLNYSGNNTVELCKLIDYLNLRFKLYKNVHIYVSPLWNTGNINDTSAYFTNASKSKDITDIYDKLLSYNYGTARGIAKMHYRMHQCMACNKYSYSVLPNGDLIKCCEAMKDHIIGNIFDGITNEQEYEFWTSLDIPSKCNTCVLLPLCQGGCRVGYCYSNMNPCFGEKYIFEDIIKWYLKAKHGIQDVWSEK